MMSRASGVSLQGAAMIEILCVDWRRHPGKVYCDVRRGSIFQATGFDRIVASGLQGVA